MLYERQTNRPTASGEKQARGLHEELDREIDSLSLKGLKDKGHLACHPPEQQGLVLGGPMPMVPSTTPKMYL